jgi:hypothetical protein
MKKIFHESASTFSNKFQVHAYAHILSFVNYSDSSRTTIFMVVNDNAIEKRNSQEKIPKTFFFVVNFADIDGKKIKFSQNPRVIIVEKGNKSI